MSSCTQTGGLFNTRPKGGNVSPFKWGGIQHLFDQRQALGNNPSYLKTNTRLYGPE